MPLNFVNKNASISEPPEDVVSFNVSINREQCGSTTAEAEAKLNGLETNGFEVSLIELIATAGAHFRDGAVDFGGYGKEQAEIARAWDNLAHCQPRAVYRSKTGKSRFVVTKSVNNPRADGLVAEILAVGVGLSLGIRFYGIPLQNWFPTGLKPTDFELKAD